jgi:hypothetical protein
MSLVLMPGTVLPLSGLVVAERGAAPRRKNKREAERRCHERRLQVHGDQNAKPHQVDA